MKFEMKRTKQVNVNVEEVKEMELLPFWVVRVIRENKNNTKECVFEKNFFHEPDGQEIADVLFDFDGKRHFASVVKNYRLTEIEPDDLSF